MKESFLYKYNPKRFNDFSTKKKLIYVLKTLIEMDTLNILLIGDHGTGKTSIIKATIREYYNLSKIPDDNIMIINNLTEQGINYYRTEVKTFCQTNSSIFGKKKFIILDNIDLINHQSQQVFRNCIDKYSKKVHFISSCTNPQKVIDSLQSRLSVFKIKKINTKLLQNILNKIKKEEKIEICKESNDFILKMCNGSIRLLINYLESFKILNLPIDLNIAKTLCTNISYDEFEKFTLYILKKKNLKMAIKILFKIYNKGYSVGDILDNYFIFTKTTNLLKESEKFKIIEIICEYITIFNTIHEDEIELALFSNKLKKKLSE